MLIPDNSKGNVSASAIPSWLGAEPEISDADCTSTIDTEVLVVGCGTGGLFACCSAAENGAKTLVIEKYAKGGGIRDDLGAINSRYQQKEGTKVDKFEYLAEMTQIAGGRVDQRLIRLWAEESAETINWYGDRLAERGVTLWHEGGKDAYPSDRYKYFATGHSPRWRGSDNGKGEVLNGNAVLTEYANSLGVEFRYETKLTKLIKENGRIVGIYAKDASDHYIRINASKGVIVCTGGYGWNYEMLQALQPENVALVGLNSSIPGATGDGIRACIWAGGKFDETHSMMMFDRCALKKDAKPGLEQLQGGGIRFLLDGQPAMAESKCWRRTFLRRIGHL